ncbi:MAG: branched chain amino acid aminotransferase, partial [Candidatus Heimdallarchaeota archaeon]|nr:branched chain amino acid aminotransferase [Candidatus Heimdallarchaeota archaeon]
MEIKVSLIPEEKRGSLPNDESRLGFGKIFTDHMYTTFFKDSNWRESCIEPFGPFVLSPAALVLHYGQEIFEGMKAFCQTNKKDVSLFRPEKNAERMKDSA